MTLPSASSPAPAPGASTSSDGRDMLHALAAVAQATSGLVVITDLRDQVVWVNASFTRVTGWTLDEARGSALSLLLTPVADDAAAGLSEPWPAPRAVDAAAPLAQPPEFKLRRKSGTPYWAQVDVRELRDAGGAPTFHLHLQTDVTERVVAEQRAQESQRWLQLAGSVFGMGLWHTSVRDGVMLWDANLKHMFGLAPDAATPSLEEILDRYVLQDDRIRLARATRNVPAPRHALGDRVPHPPPRRRAAHDRLAPGLRRLRQRRPAQPHAGRGPRRHRCAQHDCAAARRVAPPAPGR